MQINMQLTGLDDVRKTLGNLAGQANFAASRALNTTAFAINGEIKKEMQSVFKGGATAFTLRAFNIERATKQNLTATVALRDDGPAGGTVYAKALRHLFAGGARDWKKLEGYLRGMGIIPAGNIVAPGLDCPLDRFGNMRQSALTEMLGVLKSNIKNLRIYRRTGKGKQQKAVAYFVVMPGDKTKLHPGIYKRIETGKSSGIRAMIMFIKPFGYRRYIDLRAIATKVVDKTFNTEFNTELVKALESAK